MAAVAAVRTRNDGVLELGSRFLPTPQQEEPSSSSPPPAKRPKVEQLEKKKALELHKKHMAPSLTLHYSSVKPLKIVYGRGQYLYDEHDQPYLDCINNVTHVGHCHPKVVAAGIDQMTKLGHLPDPQMTETYTRHLLSTFPDNMGHVFYVTSGTEANDLALLIAETVTGNSEVIVIDGAYHGHSKPLMGLSSYKMKEKGGHSGITVNDNAWIAPLPDTFRGQYRDPATAGVQYAGEVKTLIDNMEQKGKNVSAFLCESFPGCAGQVKLPEGYFSTVFEHVHRAGGVCIIDEVQTGFGRGGECFWMFQYQGVRPDIVTVGKPMGNGHPIAAVITTKEIARDFLSKQPDYGEYKGDPVSLAISEAVLKSVEEEKKAAHAQELGEYIMNQLRQLASKHPCIGDVRGYGLFIGVEITDGTDQRAPNERVALAVVNMLLLRNRILIMNDGLDHNVLKIKPPLCFTRDNADTVLQAIDHTLTELTA